jgi:hypothetical protein
MSDSNKRKPAPEKPQASATVAASRRRLLQGGVAAGPVLMTLVSRPVLAQVAGRCTTPSGFVSLNASTAGRGTTCEGRGQGFWKTHTTSWPSPYLPTTLFNTAFNFQPIYTPFNGKTLLDVLQLGGGAPINDVARTLVAALLNAATNSLTPVLSVTTVKHMWAEYSSSGSFSPSSGASWNHDELMDYLSTTQIDSVV